MRRTMAAIAAIVLACIDGPEASAGSASTTITTSAIIGNTCTASGGTISLPSYAQTLLQDPATVLSVMCTTGAPYTIALDNGQNYASPNRRMTDGAGHYLGYNFYTSASYATAWTSTTYPASYTGTGAAQAITTWVQVPAGQNEPAGTYSDLVNVTVNY